MIKKYYSTFPALAKIVERHEVESTIADFQGMAEVIDAVQAKINATVTYNTGETSKINNRSTSNIVVTPYERCEFKDGWYNVECGTRNVTDGIGDHYKVNTIKDYKIDGYRVKREKDNRIGDKAVNRWEPSQPVFISAQTG